MSDKQNEISKSSYLAYCLKSIYQKEKKRIEVITLSDRRLS